MQTYSYYAFLNIISSRMNAIFPFFAYKFLPYVIILHCQLFYNRKKVQEIAKQNYISL